MKKLALILLTIIISSLGFSQNTSKAEIVLDNPLTVVEQMPKFQGGEVELNNYFRKNIIYPQAEKDAGITGTSYVSFVIDKEGTITKVRMLKGIPKCSACDIEAMRVITKMPKWIPGKQNGKTVDVQSMLPIKFPFQDIKQ